MRPRLVEQPPRLGRYLLALVEQRRVLGTRYGARDDRAHVQPSTSQPAAADSVSAIRHRGMAPILENRAPAEQAETGSRSGIDLDGSPGA